MSIKYEIKRHIGYVRPVNTAGWTRELNVVSWNDGEARYDLRDWSENHEKMSRGMTFTFEEALQLKKLLEEEMP